jgi:hypothetical protein
MWPSAGEAICCPFKRLILDNNAKENRQALKDSTRVVITGTNYFKDTGTEEEKAAARAEADEQIKAMAGPVKEVIKALAYAIGKDVGAFVSAVVEKKK